MSSDSIPSRASRAYDVIVFGATGFTGQLVCQYLAGETDRKTQQGYAPLRWALAGRDVAKVEKVKQSLHFAKYVQEPDVIQADSTDVKSLKKLTSQTKVILTTVGPYALYGEPLVSACVSTGTDYCDITGEAIWVRRMIDQYGELAAKNGSLIVNMCGFDSIPADLCAYMAVSELRKRGTQAAQLQGYVSVKGLAVSGGTIASMMNGLQMSSEDRKKTRNPYLLNPAGSAPSTPRENEKDQLLFKFDPLIQRWTSPWLMAQVNARATRRGLALRKELDGKGWGNEVSYNESIPHSSFFSAFLGWLTISATLLLLLFKPTRLLLGKFVLPKPGEGPSAETRAKVRFTQRVIGVGEDGQRVEASMKGGDPGYTDTAKFISETALTMAYDREKIELQQLVSKKGSSGLAGGFYNPSVVCGDVLVERLRGAGLTLAVADFKQ